MAQLHQINNFKNKTRNRNYNRVTRYEDCKTLIGLKNSVLVEKVTLISLI